MKHAIAAVCLLSFAGSAAAESELYEPIRVDAGASASRSQIDGRTGGGVVVEVKAMVQDQLAIGGRVEIAVMFGGEIGDDSAQVDVALAAAALVKAEYFVGTGDIRPFVGMGIGAYTIGGQSVASGPMTAGVDQRAGRYFGVAPSIGVDLGRFRLAATYNAILGASLEVRQTVGDVERVDTFSQNWLSLEASFQFGGGRKKRDTIVTSPVYAPAPPPPQMYPPHQN